MGDDQHQAWWRVVRLCGMVKDRYDRQTGMVRVLLDNGTEVEFRTNSWEDAVRQLQVYRPAMRRLDDA